MDTVLTEDPTAFYSTQMKKHYLPPELKGFYKQEINESETKAPEIDIRTFLPQDYDQLVEKTNI